VFATLHFKNPVKASVPSYPNVNHTFLERTISEKNFKPLRENSLGGLYFDKIVELY
jgi:hypothetical protein